MTSPKVIFNCKFTHAFNRREAGYTEKQIEGLKKKIARKFDYFSNEEKRVINLFDYYTGNLTKNETMNLVIENGSYATKEEIEKLKKLFNPKEKNFILYDKKDLILEEKILHVGKLLYEYRKDKSKKIKYNSLKNEEIKTLIKDIKKYLFVSNSKYYNDYQNFKKSLDNINDYFYNVNIDNKVAKINIDKTLTEGKREYADNYILNAIVNHSNYFFKEKSKRYHTLDENEILEEIFLEVYKKNKNQTRFNIFNNYLSSTSKTNKYQVIKAIRSINDEMEEATREFSELFENDSSYSRKL